MIDQAELARLRRIEAIVKNALSQKGDDVCWRDIYNQEVADLVGVEFDPQLLTKEEFLANCEHFDDCLRSGCPYPDAARRGLIEQTGGHSAGSIRTNVGPRTGPSPKARP
jgi:hypothetical protein